MKIVVFDAYALNPGDLDWTALRALGETHIYERTPPDEIVMRATDASIVLTNKTPLSADVLAQLPALRYIGVLATGTNVVDVAAAQAQNIIVTNIPRYGSYSVAQMVMAHLLTLCHRVQQHSDTVIAGYWATSPDWCFWQSPQVELYGKTMGIVGFGEIGQQVARVAAALGMRIAVHSRTQHALAVVAVEWLSLEALLRTADVVSLNCPLTSETAGMINRHTLNLMPSHAILINTARGGLIVEADLAEALNAGQIAAAALDVLSSEPPSIDNPLLSAKNVLITPHIAWATFEARHRLMDMAVANVQAFLAGVPQNTVTS